MNDILTARLKECTTRIGSMCGDGRPPRMSVPVRDDDDDIFITTTCLQAAKEIDRLRDSTEQCRVYRDTLEKTGRDIGNLLALIHRDGGHYEAVHGRDMALDEAGRIVGSFNSAVDQWEVDYNEMKLERDALALDAESYRWLREKTKTCSPEGVRVLFMCRGQYLVRAGKPLDEAIDFSLKGTS